MKQTPEQRRKVRELAEMYRAMPKRQQRKALLLLELFETLDKAGAIR